jgi:hypothetical protein
LAIAVRQVGGVFFDLPQRIHRTANKPMPDPQKAAKSAASPSFSSKNPLAQYEEVWYHIMESLGRKPVSGA